MVNMAVYFFLLTLLIQLFTNICSFVLFLFNKKEFQINKILFLVIILNLFLLLFFNNKILNVENLQVNILIFFFLKL